jgi:hypothetical protein
MAGFAVEDMFLKSVTAHIPLGQALLIFGLIGATFFAIRARGQARPAPSRPPLPPPPHPLLLRGRGSPLLLPRHRPHPPLHRLRHPAGHPPRRRRRRGASLRGTGRLAALDSHHRGLCGRPPDPAPRGRRLHPLSLVTVVGIIGFAGRDLATRAAPPALSNRQLGLIGMAMLALAGAIILTVTGGAPCPTPPRLPFSQA